MSKDTDFMREVLIRALELANEAVRSDSLDGDPFTAMAAYKRSIALLAHVIEGLQGEGRWEPNTLPDETEIRRLQEIRDVYEHRMSILYSVHGDLPRRRPTLMSHGSTRH